ncbi:hypothetical protein UPYG_G00073770 [Umbra pygmaea]|uniref:Uncharacterized protein n=1 Tax=Umbra pygmaea TaxID=75934 RepID=A0ABD0XCA0_UMBPY
MTRTCFPLDVASKIYVFVSESRGEGIPIAAVFPVGTCARVNIMSRPQSRSPQYSHRDSPRRQDGRRFPWDDPDFDPQQVLAGLGRLPWEDNRGPGDPHEDHWARFMDEIHPDGHRRPMSPENLRAEAHKIPLSPDLHRLDHLYPSEDFHQGRTPLAPYELGYAERRRLSSHDGEVGDRARLREDFKISEESQCLPHSPQKLPRERLPSLAQQHPHHQQRASSAGWRREDQDQSQGRSRDRSPMERFQGGGRDSLGPYRERRKNAMSHERSTASDRNWRETNKALQPGYERDAEFRERRPSLEWPQEQRCPQGTHDGLGPRTLIVEHDHGIMSSEGPEPYSNRFSHHQCDGGPEEKFKKSGSRPNTREFKDRPARTERRGPVHEERRGAVHEERRGPVHEERRGPVHEERRGPVHEERRGPVHGERRGPVHGERRGPVHGERRGPVHGERRGPVHEERRGPVHEERRGPVHEERRGPVHEERRGPVHEERRGPVHGERRGRVHGERRDPILEPRRSPDHEGIVIPMGFQDRSSPTQPRARNSAFRGLRGATGRSSDRKTLPSRNQQHLLLQEQQDHETWVAIAQHSHPEHKGYPDRGGNWDIEPREEQPGWAEETDMETRWKQNRGPGPRGGRVPVQSRIGAKKPELRERNSEWNQQNDMAMLPMVTGEEETLTIKVDMNRAVGQNSQLCYSTDRQLSLDLVNVGRQRLDFLPMLEHSGTYRESAMHSGTFAQEIITLVHQVKEHYFRGVGVTLNERFSGTQDLNLPEEVEQEEERLTLNRRFNMSMSEPDIEPLFSKAGLMKRQQQMVSDPGDLRHDLERKRQQRLEGVKVTIPGGQFTQRPMAAGSDLMLQYGSEEEEGREDEEGPSGWLGAAQRGGQWTGHMGGLRRGGMVRHDMAGQRRNFQPPNRTGNRPG